MAHGGDWVASNIDGEAMAEAAAHTPGAPARDGVATPPSTSEAGPFKTSRLSSSDLARLIVRGGVWSLIISASGAALSLGVHLILARILGSEEYGRYVFALAWMNVLLLVGKFELDTASVRFVGAYSGTDQWAFLRGFLTRSSQIVLLMSVGIMLASAVLIGVLMGQFERGTALSFLAASLLLPVSAMGQLKASALQGFKHVVRSQAPSMVVRPVVFVLGIVVLRYGFQRSVSAPVAILLQFAATTVALILTIWFLQTVMPERLRQATEAFDTRYWMKTAA